MGQTKGEELNILLLASHAIAEYDDLRMLTDLGYDVFAPGGYSDPQHPNEAPATKDAGMGPLRPPLPYRYRADLDRLCQAQRDRHEGEPAARTKWAIDWAKQDLHPDLIDWADAIIVHHFPERWIAGQWRNIKGKRVIWRTCGQSGPDLEELMAHYRKFGLEIVRYSPRERLTFEPMKQWAGEDAMIRFGKYPSDWYGWTGEDAVVGNLTQSMTDRGSFTGESFYRQATEGLPAKPAGGGSEELPGGLGLLSYDGMREYLRRVRVFAYLGTAPASYTLALIEAMMTGTPVVSVSSKALWPVYDSLFEGHEISGIGADTPAAMRALLGGLLEDRDYAQEIGHRQRQIALALFGIETVGRQWLAFLGNPARATVQHEAPTVTA